MDIETEVLGVMSKSKMVHPSEKARIDAMVLESQQRRAQAHAVLRDLLAELEASELSGTFTTSRRIKANASTRGGGVRPKRFPLSALIAHAIGLGFAEIPRGSSVVDDLDGSATLETAPWLECWAGRDRVRT